MVTHTHLIEFSEKIFSNIGCSESDSKIAAEVLVSADLRGIDSHGVARLPGYVRLWEAGRINAQPNIRVKHETPSTAVVDGDRGLGLVVSPYAMELAMKKAEQVGTGWVAVQNSNHFGIAGYHSMMALEKDMIGISMTNASPLVAPTFSKERLLGTNPISVAIPAGKEPAYVADFATTTAANGKLEILQRKGGQAPRGWVQDKEGNISTDPNEVENGGALLPLGGARETGGHKGYILGSLVDIFSAVLSGANYGPWVPPFVSFLGVRDDLVGDGIGHFFGAMRIDAFRSSDDFKSHMDNWISRFRKAETIEGQERVLIPGDVEREEEAIRRNKGISLDPKVEASLKELGQKFSVPF